jgi:hypothetical protein
LLKKPLTIDREPEVLGVNERSTHEGVVQTVLFRRVCVRVTRDGPGADMSLDLATLPTPTLDEFSSDLLAELPP